MAIPFFVKAGIILGVGLGAALTITYQDEIAEAARKFREDLEDAIEKTANDIAQAIKEKKQKRHGVPVRNPNDYDHDEAGEVIWEKSPEQDSRRASERSNSASDYDDDDLLWQRASSSSSSYFKNDHELRNRNVQNNNGFSTLNKQASSSSSSIATLQQPTKTSSNSTNNNDLGLNPFDDPLREPSTIILNRSEFLTESETDSVVSYDSEETPSTSSFEHINTLIIDSSTDFDSNTDIVTPLGSDAESEYGVSSSEDGFVSVTSSRSRKMLKN